MAKIQKIYKYDDALEQIKSEYKKLQFPLENNTLIALSVCLRAEKKRSEGSDIKFDSDIGFSQVVSIPERILAENARKPENIKDQITEILQNDIKNTTFINYKNEINNMLYQIRDHTYDETTMNPQVLLIKKFKMASILDANKMYEVGLLHTSLENSINNEIARLKQFRIDMYYSFAAVNNIYANYETVLEKKDNDAGRAKINKIYSEPETVDYLRAIDGRVFRMIVRNFGDTNVIQGNLYRLYAGEFNRFVGGYSLDALYDEETKSDIKNTINTILTGKFLCTIADSQAFIDGDYEMAVKHYEIAVKNPSDNAASYELMARLHVKITHMPGEYSIGLSKAEELWKKNWRNQLWLLMAMADYQKKNLLEDFFLIGRDETRKDNTHHGQVNNEFLERETVIYLSAIYWHIIRSIPNIKLIDEAINFYSEVQESLVKYIDINDLYATEGTIRAKVLDILRGNVIVDLELAEKYINEDKLIAVDKYIALGEQYKNIDDEKRNLNRLYNKIEDFIITEGTEEQTKKNKQATIMYGKLFALSVHTAQKIYISFYYDDEASKLACTSMHIKIVDGFDSIIPPMVKRLDKEKYDLIVDEKKDKREDIQKKIKDTFKLNPPTAYKDRTWLNKSDVAFWFINTNDKSAVIEKTTATYSIVINVRAEDVSNWSYYTGMGLYAEYNNTKISEQKPEGKEDYWCYKTLKDDFDCGRASNTDTVYKTLNKYIQIAIEKKQESGVLSEKTMAIMGLVTVSLLGLGACYLNVGKPECIKFLRTKTSDVLSKLYHSNIVQTAKSAVWNKFLAPAV